MKVLLVKPRFSVDDSMLSSKANSVIPSIGLLYIASLLRENKHIVQVIDLDVEKSNFQNLFLKFNPDIVGITATTPLFPGAVKVSKEIKKLKKVPIVLGGVHASSVGSKILEKYDSFDYLVKGEGEYVMLDLVNGKAPSKIDGLCYRSKRKVIDKAATYVENLDSLPFPSRDLIEKYIYDDSPVYSRYQKGHATILFSRGCAYKCIFCSHKIKGRIRFRSTQNILDELKQLYKRGYRDFRILDEFFTMNKKLTEEVCTGIIKNNLKISWNVQTRADSLDENIIKTMKKAGCWCVQLGVETGNKDVMKRINKNLDLEKTINSVNLLRKNGIFTIAFFMLGFPGETEKEMRDTIKYSKRLDADMATFSIVTPYPATDIWDISGLNSLDEKTIRNLSMYSDKSYFIKDINIQKLFSYAVRSYYFRPKIMLRILKEALLHGDMGRRKNYLMLLLEMGLPKLTLSKKH